jgi:hypothetical protein
MGTPLRHFQIAMAKRAKRVQVENKMSVSRTLLIRANFRRHLGPLASSVRRNRFKLGRR